MLISRRAIDTLVPMILERGLPRGICLNVNVPDIGSVPADMRLAVPCRGHWNDEYKEYTDPHGNKFYWLTGKFENEEPENRRMVPESRHHLGRACGHRPLHTRRQQSRMAERNIGKIHIILTVFDTSEKTLRSCNPQVEKSIF